MKRFVNYVFFYLILSLYQMIGYSIDLITKKAEIEEVVDWVSDVGYCIQLYHNENSNVNKKCNELLNFKHLDNPNLSLQLSFYYAILSSLSSNNIKYQEYKSESLKSHTFNPEILFYEIYLIKPNDIEYRLKVWDDMGLLIPLSNQGSNRDNRLTSESAGYDVDIDPPLPEIPKNDGLGKSMKSIGDIYYSSGCYRKAIDSYLESLLLPYPFSPYDINDNTDQGKNKSYIWMRIAKTEYALGQYDLSVRAYLMSVYLNKDNIPDVVDAIYKVLFDKTNVSSFEEGQLDYANAKKISDIYLSVNLHPIAMSTLKNIKYPTDSIENNINIINAEWNAILARYEKTYGRKNVYILGNRIENVSNWSDVKVARPSESWWIPKNICILMLLSEQH